MQQRQTARAGPEQLELPLFVVHAVDEDDWDEPLPEVTTGARVAGKPLLRDVIPERVESVRIRWTPEHIRCLREGVLMDALKSLMDGRNSSKTQQELWEWVNSDDIHPFSFNVCAEEVGCRPDELRAAFTHLVRRAKEGAKVNWNAIDALGVDSLRIMQQR